MISSTLSQCSADMREQADRVEEALSRRIAETEEATRRLEDELKAVRMNTFQKYFFSRTSTRDSKIEWI